VVRLPRLALILILATVVNWPAADRGNAIPPAIVENYGHLTVLRLHGTPYEMGYQHGVAQRAVIRRWVDDEVYRRVIIEDGQSHGILLAQVHQLERALPAEIRRELHGIADGAGLSYDDVLLLNLVLNRLTSLALTSTNAMPPLPVLDLQALAFAAWPPATSQESALDDTLLGYCLDAPGEAGQLRQHLLAVIYQPTDGQAYATLTWSGQVGAWCGLNEAGLAVCATPAEPARGGDAGHRELFPPILVRQLLAHAQDGEQALRQAVRHDYLAAFQLLVADGRRQSAMAITFDTHRHETIASQTGLLTFGPDRAPLPSLLNRNLGWLDRDKALAALSSRQAPGEELPGVCGESTLLNALFVPRRGELWVGIDLWPASCRRYLRLRLTG
jgi:hypothetical protein